MATLFFDSTLFRGLFPVFSNTVTYPDAMIEFQWDLASSYITNNTITGRWEGMSLAQQINTLNLMTAHLLELNRLLAAGQSTGVLTGATIDKVSVQLQPPPEKSQWQWWLNQTPYGQQLLALLQVMSAGGFFFSAGAPVVGAFRRRWR